MNWNNLKANKCPKCAAWLLHIDGRIVHEALPPCDFKISKEKFDELVNKMYQNPRAQFNTTDNMEALNNLGHEKVEEDFSDSKALDY
jgi:hypothetical protein